MDSMVFLSMHKPPAVDDSVLEKIRDDIKCTTRPSWQQPPPSNFGLTKHGKLSAEQWHFCMDFDLPVSFVQSWWGSLQCAVDSRERERLSLLMDNIMALAQALIVGTSRRTSRSHADRYTEHMLSYLCGLKQLQVDLIPNHHLALHIGEILPRFGPTQGWWTYPYERLIHKLGKMNTNYKIVLFHSSA